MTAKQPAQKTFPGKIVLVFQGGGALGAYQLGVYQAMEESGIHPDWVVGTSIGAINAALIAGNPPEHRYQRLTEFWDRVSNRTGLDAFGWSKTLTELTIMTSGISGFFQPNPASWLGPLAELGAERASYYLVEPLRETLMSLVDFNLLNSGRPRLTVGAVSACTGNMRYFDSRDQRLGAAPRI